MKANTRKLFAFIGSKAYARKVMTVSTYTDIKKTKYRLVATSSLMVTVRRAKNVFTDM